MNVIKSIILVICLSIMLVNLFMAMFGIYDMNDHLPITVIVGIATCITAILLFRPYKRDEE